MSETRNCNYFTITVLKFNRDHGWKSENVGLSRILAKWLGTEGIKIKHSQNLAKYSIKSITFEKMLE